jgi:hypothetical protein
MTTANKGFHGGSSPLSCLPRRLFQVVYESRKLGSIGAWSLVSGSVEASGQSEALERFRAERPGFEFRFPSECREVQR